MNNLANKSLRSLGFHISATEYLKQSSPHFTDFTNFELIAELTVVNNLSQVVTDLKEKLMKKKNKLVVRRNEQLIKLRASIRSLLFLCSESLSLFSPCSVLATISIIVLDFVPALLPFSVTTPVSCLESPVILSSCRVPTLAASATISLPRHTLVSRCGVSILPSLLSVLAPSLSF